MLRHCFPFQQQQHYYYYVALLVIGIFVTPATVTADDEQQNYNYDVTVPISQVTGGLSMIGSILILNDIIFVDRTSQKWNMPYHRIMAGMSFLDMCSSFWYFIIGWIRPDQFTIDDNIGVSSPACVASGFFTWLASLCIPLYNASLAIYFNLSVRYGWKEDQIHHKFERYVHPIIITYGLAFVIPALFLEEFYNPDYQICYPLNQENHPNATMIYFLFYFLSISLSAITVTVLMLKVYFYVRKVLKTRRQSRINSSNNTNRNESSELLRGPVVVVLSSPDSHTNNPTTTTTTNIQESAKKMKRSSLTLEEWLPKVRTMAMAYTIPFYITWLVPLCWNTIFLLASAGAIDFPTTKTRYIMQVYVATALPLQGFFNWIIYINLFGRCLTCCNMKEEGGRFSLKGLFITSRGRRSNESEQEQQQQQQQLVPQPPPPPRMEEPSSSKSKDGTMSNPENNNDDGGGGGPTPSTTMVMADGGTPYTGNNNIDDNHRSGDDIEAMEAGATEISDSSSFLGTQGDDDDDKNNNNNNNNTEAILEAGSYNNNNIPPSSEESPSLHDDPRRNNNESSSSHHHDTTKDYNGSSSPDQQQQQQQQQQQPPTTTTTVDAVQEALENALGLVRESIRELTASLNESSSSSSEGGGGVDADTVVASVDSRTRRTLDMITDAIELTQSFVGEPEEGEEESNRAATNHSSPPPSSQSSSAVQQQDNNVTQQPTTTTTRNNTNNNRPSSLMGRMSNNMNASTPNAAVGCRAPPMMPLFPLSESGMTTMPPSFLPLSSAPPPSPSRRTPHENRRRLQGLLHDALDVVNSDLESITNGSHDGSSIADVRSILSGSQELEGMLEESLDVLNNTFLPPSRQQQRSSSSHRQQQQQQHQHDDAIQRRRTTPTAFNSRVPTTLESVRRAEVSTLSSTVLEDDDGHHNEEEHEEEESNNTNETQ